MHDIAYFQGTLNFSEIKSIISLLIATCRQTPLLRGHLNMIPGMSNYERFHELLEKDLPVFLIFCCNTGKGEQDGGWGREEEYF